MSRCAVKPSPSGPRRFFARRWVRRLIPFAFGMVLAAGLLVGAQAQAATAPARPAGTIEPEGGYEKTVQALALRHIANVPGDPSFAPTDGVTRAQMAVYLARALRLPDDRYSAFVDVKRGDWGFGAIGALYRAGVIDGTTPLTFSPNRPVSRQEAAALLVAALRYSVEKQGAVVGDSLTPYRIKELLAGFRDKGLIGPAYATDVAIAYRVGLFDAPSEGLLFPSLSLTQNELTAMLERAFLARVATRAISTSATSPAAVDPCRRVSQAVARLERADGSAAGVAAGGAALPLRRDRREV